MSESKETTTTVTPKRKIKKPLIDKSFWDYQRFPSWRRERGLLQIAILAFIFLLGAVGLIYKYYAQIPPEIPLFWNQIGAQALTAKRNLLYLPLGFIFFCLINFYLAHLFFYKEKLLSQLLIYVSLLVNFLFIFVIVRMLMLMNLLIIF